MGQILPWFCSALTLLLAEVPKLPRRIHPASRLPIAHSGVRSGQDGPRSTSPTSRYVSTIPLPLRCSSARRCRVKREPSCCAVVALTWIEPGTPCDSSRLAVFTVSPHTSYRKRFPRSRPRVQSDPEADGQRQFAAELRGLGLHCQGQARHRLQVNRLWGRCATHHHVAVSHRLLLVGRAVAGCQNDPETVADLCHRWDLETEGLAVLFDRELTLSRRRQISENWQS